MSLSTNLWLWKLSAICSPGLARFETHFLISLLIKTSSPYSATSMLLY